MLSHQADIAVFDGIIVEVVVTQWIGFVERTLFKMESVVLDICLHAGLVHEAVVFIRAITGVGNRH